MGKGDKRSKRGKITIGTYGKARAKTKKPAVTAKGKPAPKKPAPKKAPGKRT